MRDQQGLKMRNTEGKPNSAASVGQNMWEAAEGPSKSAKVTSGKASVDNTLEDFADLDISPDFQPIKSTDQTKQNADTGSVGKPDEKQSASEKEVPTPADVNEQKPSKSKMPMIAAAVCTLVAATVIGIMSFPKVSAEQSNYESAIAIEPPVPAASAESIKLPETGSIQLQEHVLALPVEPDPVPVSAPAVEIKKVIKFTEAIESESKQINGRSLAQLVRGNPAFTPIEGLPDTEWQGKTCSGCHSWDKATLCKQGGFYVKHGLGAVSRSEHPYGGEFKHEVMAWADEGCQ